MIPNDTSKSKVQYQPNNALSKALPLHLCCYFLPTAMSTYCSWGIKYQCCIVMQYHISKQVHSTCTLTWQPWSKTWYCEWVLHWPTYDASFPKGEGRSKYHSIWYTIQILDIILTLFPDHSPASHTTCSAEMWKVVEHLLHEKATLSVV